MKLTTGTSFVAYGEEPTLRRVVAGLVPILLIVLAGCSGGGQAASAKPGQAAVPEPASVEIPVISTEAQMVSYSSFPLDAYSLEFDSDTIFRAEHELTSACVAAKGFDLGPYRPPGFQAPARRAPLAQQFGVGVIAEVQKYGYDLPPEYSSGPPPTPTPMSSAQAQALDIALKGPVDKRPAVGPMEVPGGGKVVDLSGSGFTPDSCLGQAVAALKVAGDPRELNLGRGSVLVENLAFDTFQRARADSRVVAADRDWSACMKDKGFDVPAPDKSAITYSKLARTAAIPAATADVQCKYAKNYFGIRYGVQAAYQKAAIEANAQALDAIAAEHKVTLAQAKAVLNEH